MKGIVYFDFPLDNEDGQRMIDKAREIGYPILAVVLPITGEFTDQTPHGMTAEMQSGVEFAQKMDELAQEFAAMAGPSRPLHARVILDGDPLMETI